MKNLIYLHCFVLIMLLSACNSDEMQEEKEDYPEYFIFGRFSGLCTGDQCIEIYKIQNDSLFEAEDIYPWLDENGLSDAEFYFIGNEKLPLVIDLKEKIPEELLNETSYVIGCPDCTDQGGIFIEISTTDFHHHWIIDPIKEEIPDELHPLIDLVREKILLLR